MRGDLALANDVNARLEFWVLFWFGFFSWYDAVKKKKNCLEAL
jgi:hypothetical protein